MKRKICVVITARPSYSRVKTALAAISNHPELELQLVIAASALLSKYGNATSYILKDGFDIKAKVYNVLEGGNLLAQAKTTGLGIIELSNVFQSLNPDAVLTIADRYETMSTAIAATYMNIPLIHLQGGEITGNIDEKVRHAITKLADIHLVCTQNAKENVIRMGENPEQVYLTGCPSIDLALEINKNGNLDYNPYVKYGGVGEKPGYEDGYLVVLQHPVTTEYSSAKQQALITLDSIQKTGKTAFWFWPNVDAGSDGTSNAIRSFRETRNSDNLHFFKNMEPMDFLKLIKNSLCLVGNSSVGLRESGFLGIPVVNIGSRQEGRQRGENVLDVDHIGNSIIDGIQFQIEKKAYPSNPIYGNGNAGSKIADVVSKANLTFKKKLNY